MHLNFLAPMAFLLALIGLVAPCAQAAQTSLETVVAALQKPFQPTTRQNRIRDFQARFTQEAYLGSLDQLQTASGRVVVSFADQQTPVARFRWEYLQPDPQLIVSDGRTLWVYVPENRQVIESPVPVGAQAGEDNPLAFLTDLGNLSRQFTISWGSPRKSPEGHFRLVLQPRQPSAYIEKLAVEVDKNVVAGKTGYPLLTATLFGTGDNRTTVRFSEVSLNRSPAPSLYRFSPPPGTEIIRPGKGTAFEP